MTIRYDQKTDTLTIILGPELYETYEYEAGDATVALDEADTLTEVTIANAGRFVAQALAGRRPG